MRNIEVFSIAIGSESGTGSLYISKKSNWCSMAPHGATGYITKIDVEVSSLDTFVVNKPEPTFIRMDVEGYEYEIIEGMHNIMKDNKPLRLLMEVHVPFLGIDKTILLLQTLKEHGFRLERVIVKRIPETHQVKWWVNRYLDYLSRRIGEPDYSDITIDDAVNCVFLEQCPFFEAYFVR